MNQLALSLGTALGVVAKVTLVLTAAGLAAMTLRRASAAIRHLVWLLAVGGAVAVVAIAPAAPSIVTLSSSGLEIASWAASTLHRNTRPRPRRNACSRPGAAPDCADAARTPPVHGRRVSGDPRPLAALDAAPQPHQARGLGRGGRRADDPRGRRPAAGLRRLSLDPSRVRWNHLTRMSKRSIFKSLEHVGRRNRYPLPPDALLALL